jgi:uncharacterized protein (TIGR00375 family)
MEKQKKIFVDLHLHSRFSRACSKDLTFENLVKWARIKGLDVLGTGDFTHQTWFNEIENFKEDKGVYYYKDFPFIITGEISLMYSQGGRGRRVHLVVLVPSLDAARKIHQWLDTKGRRDYDGRPIFKISCRDFSAKMQELDERIEVIPAHIWTPYFGVFGSKSGFDSLEEAFLDKIDRVHAVETGISSDPEMNWKIKDLNNISILSFSDAHSFWPWRIGREATIFSLKENEKLSYDTILGQIRNHNYLGTVEVDPAYGIYHFDGHKDCKFSSSPGETKKLKGICPVCGKPLTLGVDYRVEELTSQKIEENKNKKMYYKILPLHELISLALGTGISSKGCWKIYNDLIEVFGNELRILLESSKIELAKAIKNELLIELILANREGKIKVKPGYDGLYGEAVLSEKQGKLF